MTWFHDNKHLCACSDLQAYSQTVVNIDKDAKVVTLQSGAKVGGQRMLFIGVELWRAGNVAVSSIQHCLHTLDLADPVQLPAVHSAPGHCAALAGQARVG